MKRVTVQYYALFREQRGLREEILETQAETAADLYRELGLSLSPDLVRVSINLQFKPLNAVLSSGDTVVFIPPVAGG